METSGSGPVTVGAGCTGAPPTLWCAARGGTSSPHPTTAKTVAASPAHTPPRRTNRRPPRPIEHLPFLTPRAITDSPR